MGLDRRWDETELDLLRRRLPIPTRSPAAQRDKRYKLKMLQSKPDPKLYPKPPVVRPPKTTPDPDWWERARKMKAHGMGTVAIAEALGKSRTMVRYALNPKYRAREKARLRAIWHSHEGKEERAAKRRKYPRDIKREKAREEARERWRRDGGNLTSHYRQLDCL